MKKWTENWPIEDLLIFRNDEITVLNKPAGVLSQSDVAKDYSILRHFSRKHRRDYHLINRIDRPVSGLIIMTAQSGLVKELSAPNAFTKKYYAITTIKEEKEGTLEHYMKRDGKAMKARISDTPKSDFKKAELTYSVVKTFDRYELVEVTPQTGRFHQIRAQLAQIGRHIKGDVKYGARRSNGDRSIDLHAYQIDMRSNGMTLKANALRESTMWNIVNEEYIKGLKEE